MFGRALLLSAAVVAVAGCATTAPDTAADEARLRAEAPVWFDHYNRGDAEAVTNLYAEDGVILAPGAPAAVGREAIRSYLTGDIASSKAGGFAINGGDVTGVGVEGDLAWMTGTFTVTDSAGATVDSGKYLSLFRREGSDWKLIRDIWNSDAAPPAPAAPAAPAG